MTKKSVLLYFGCFFQNETFIKDASYGRYADFAGVHMDQQYDIKKIKSMHKMKQKILDTTDLHHMKVYVDSVEKYLRDKDGKIMYERLDDPDTQKKFIDHMLDQYHKHAAAELNAEPGNEFQKEMLLKTHLGVTSAELSAHIANYGKDYTVDQHTQFKANLRQHQEQEMSQLIYSPIRHEHIDQLLKDIDAKGVDSKRVGLQDAVTLLNAYLVNEGTVPERLLKKYKPRKKKEK